MGGRYYRRYAFPPVTFDVSEGVDPQLWAISPTRYLIGGISVWKSEGMVSQPNRWGVIQSEFPPNPCTVEIDPLVAAHLPLPSSVVGFVDRAHRALEPPVESEDGRRAIGLARKLAGRLEQLRGVGVAFRPFARTIPLITPVEADALIEHCARAGVTGIRGLAHLGGGVALSVQPSMDEGDLAEIATIIGSALT